MFILCFDGNSNLVAALSLLGMLPNFHLETLPLLPFAHFLTFGATKQVITDKHMPFSHCPQGGLMLCEVFKGDQADATYSRDKHYAMV